MAPISKCTLIRKDRRPFDVFECLFLGWQSLLCMGMMSDLVICKQSVWSYNDTECPSRDHVSLNNTLLTYVHVLGTNKISIITCTPDILEGAKWSSSSLIAVANFWSASMEIRFIFCACLLCIFVQVLTSRLQRLSVQSVRWSMKMQDSILFSGSFFQSFWFH